MKYRSYDDLQDDWLAMFGTARLVSKREAMSWIRTSLSTINNYIRDGRVEVVINRVNEEVLISKVSLIKLLLMEAHQ